MDVLACLKRVPETGAKIVLTDDQQDIDTTNLGFTMSPHEECGIEEAVQIVEETGGSATVLTLGGEEAKEQVRTGLAMQADDGVLLDNGGGEWDPQNVAGAIADYIADRMEEDGFDLLIFGNESADAGNYQVGVRVAEQLDLPIVTSIKALAVEEESGTVIAEREVGGGSEVYELDLPAVVAVKEGLNEPRYASMRARMRARKQTVESVPVEKEREAGLEKVRLETPETDEGTAEILGEDASPETIDNVIEVFEELEVL
ncbi:electron transfer flavoprotein subunit beta [Halobacteriales archaeon SW_10_68_16]|nr:MAG: electron transfer flavoprotein subunit beta [Halobacteriales archaeon SW_10_68_16]